MLAGQGITATSAPVKAKLFLPAAFRRLNMWGGLNFPVYVVVVPKDGVVHIRSGRITKMPDTAVGTIRNITVLLDAVVGSKVSSTTDIEVGDPNMFAMTEIGLLWFPQLAEVWFGNMYSPQTIAAIRQATKEIKFPTAEWTAEPEGQNWLED